MLLSAYSYDPSSIDCTHWPLKQSRLSHCLNDNAAVV